MKRARRARIVGIATAMVCGLTVLVSFATSCSNAGEGERCQAENGDSDCQSPLVCLAATQKQFNGGRGLVNEGFRTSDRCCPLDRSTAMHPACVNVTASATEDGAAPPGDTGPVPDATTPETGISDGSNDADGADGG